MFVVLDIKVFPNSGKSEFKLDGNILKAYLKNTPEKGKANKELIQLISTKLKIAKFDIVLLSGMTTRIKKVRIKTNLNIGDIINKLIS